MQYINFNPFDYKKKIYIYIYIYHGFPLKPNFQSEIQLALCNVATMNNSKTLKSVDLPLLTADDKKPFTVNTKANIVNF